MTEYQRLWNDVKNDRYNEKKLEALGDWFWKEGDQFWNGESWECEDGERLFPIYREAGFDCWMVVGYELR